LAQCGTIVVPIAGKLNDELSRKEGKGIVPRKRARLYDVLALCLVIIIVACDQWTKSLIVRSMNVGSEAPFPILGHYLAFDYVQNSGAAFSMLAGHNGSILLAVLIAIAIVIVCFLYARMINTGSLAYKLIFGLILGGALGNLTDRIVHSGYVVDFISFRIPEINYYFAIFNVADACISVGVILLFLMVFFGGLKQPNTNEERRDSVEEQNVSKDASVIENNYRATTEHNG
jgi:signal peptidase II